MGDQEGTGLVGETGLITNSILFLLTYIALFWDSFVLLCPKEGYFVRLRVHLTRLDKAYLVHVRSTANYLKGASS